VALGVVIAASKLTAAIWVHAIAAPEPAVNEFVLVQDGLEFLWNVFDHLIWLVDNQFPPMAR
jgi:hypothetical protein